MPGSIHERIREDLIAGERRLWTALTSADPAPEIELMCNDQATFMFPNTSILVHSEGSSALAKTLAPPFHHFDRYELSEVRVHVIDLMAGTITYRINAVQKNQEFRATGSTTWSQGSDGEWRIVNHQETLV